MNGPFTIVKHNQFAHRCFHDKNNIQYVSWLVPKYLLCANDSPAVNACPTSFIWLMLLAHFQNSVIQRYHKWHRGNISSTCDMKHIRIYLTSSTTTSKAGISNHSAVWGQNALSGISIPFLCTIGWCFSNITVWYKAWHEMVTLPLAPPGIFAQIG